MGQNENILKYEVVDNFLPKSEYEKIYDVIMKSHQFPWFYEPNISFFEKASRDYLFYLVHIFYINNKSNSFYFNILDNLLIKLQPRALIRIKANFYPNQNTKKLNEPHIDFPYSHNGAVYSINTCNGGTIMEDGTLIESIANRIVFFDAGKTHDSLNCTDAKARVNINFNYF